MITTTISDFRKDIKRYLDRVSKNFETLIINRGKDSGVVVISLDEYNSLTETQHELSSKKNEARLDSAIEKLKSKLAALEAEREKAKAFNRAARKNGTEKLPWYTLPYLGKDIKRIKERIAQLEQVDQMPAEIIEFDAGEIESDPVTNRVIIRHDKKPDDETIRALKSNGFHWSHSEKAWQRLRNLNALYAAKAICGVKEAKS